MDSAYIVLEKLVYLFLLVLAGIMAARFRLITDESIQGMSRLLVDIFWPAMIIASICSALTRADIIANALLPLLGLVTAGCGYVIGLIAVRVFGVTGSDRGIFLYDSAINNFVYFPLAFITTMLPGKGPAFLFIHNLGFLLAIWTFGVSSLRGKGGYYNVFKSQAPIGLIATIIGVGIAFFNVKMHTPETLNKFLFLVFDTLGKPTLTVAMIVAGAEIYKLGFKALHFDRWNILLGAIRLVVIPFTLFCAAFALKATGVSQEIITVFLFVSIMPVSVNSISLALRFGANAQRAAQAVVFTHLFGIATVIAFMVAIEKFF